MEAVVIGSIFLVLMFLGVPIGTALGIAGIVTIYQFNLGIGMFGALNVQPAGARMYRSKLAEEEMRLARLDDVALVTQSAMNALNPVYRVGDQCIEAIEAHTDFSKAECEQIVKKLFDAVGLQAGMMKAYPHEFSGGMRQRSMIAMSLVLNPDLVIMDEPTTGLDVLVQERILRNIKEIRKMSESSVSILLITHDISVIAEMSDRIGIMYAGRLMEFAESMELFNEPYHPYTLGLKSAFPSIQALDRELISIPGSPPSLLGDLPGCLFAFRCPFVIPECEKERPPDLEIKPGHFVHCIRTDHVEEFRKLAVDKKTWQSSTSAT